MWLETRYLSCLKLYKNKTRDKISSLKPYKILTRDKRPNISSQTIENINLRLGIQFVETTYIVSTCRKLKQETIFLVSSFAESVRETWSLPIQNVLWRPGLQHQETTYLVSAHRKYWLETWYPAPRDNISCLNMQKKITRDLVSRPVSV